MSLLARIFALVLIALVPAVAVEAWNEAERWHEREALLHANALRYTRMAVAEIRNALRGLQQTLATLAATVPVQNLDGAACDRLLSSLREQYPPYLDVLAADREGNVLCGTDGVGRFPSLAGRPVFARALAENTFVVGQYADSEAAATPTLSAAFPVHDAANRTIGVVMGSIQLWWFQERLSRGLPAETAFVLIDRQHTILARHPETATYVGQKLPPEFVPNITRAGTGPVDGVGLDGISRIGAVEALSFGGAPDLFVGVALSQPAAFRELEAATRRTVLLTSLGLLLATVAAIAAGRFFVERPFARLLEVARRWTEGETRARTGLSGRSEFARLGRAFDTMADAIEARTAALVASEVRLRTALEATGAGTWDFDLQSGERHWSPRLIDLLGLPPGTEPSPEALFDAVHPEDRARVEEVYRLAFEERTGYSAEFRTRPGRWLAARGRILFSPDGRPARSVGTVLDITDAKRVEAALFERSPVALFVIRVQPGGRFVYEEVNSAFCQYTGVRPETIVGRAPEEIFDSKVAVLLNHHYGTCFRSGRRHEYEIAGDLPAGYLVRRTILEPIEWDEHGQVRRILAAAMDLTEARQLEAALRHSQKIEALGQLTGGVAHDFNNLLTAVLGNLWLLMRNLPEGRERRLAEHAARAAERGARLTEQLLAFARRQQMTLEPVDLNALISGMRDMLARTLGARIEVVTELAPDLWPALADPNQIELVLLNLAINARDAMPDGGPMRISTANVRTGDRRLPPDLEGDYVMLAVADNGIGMSEAVRSRAFEPFFTTKEIGKGSGLGLSMVYGVATQSGGSAVIESAPGKGAIVRVFLERHDATEASA